MTNNELEKKLTILIREERKITNEILVLINLALERKLYLELGFSSMFDWLVRGFGYSNAAAYRRIEGAKMLKAVPEVAKKLEDGKTNLTNLSKAQNIIQAQEKKLGLAISTQEKADLLKKIENKSTRQTEQILFATFPEAGITAYQERRVSLPDNKTRHMMTLSQEATIDLNRAKEVLSHKFPNASDADIVTFSLKFLLQRMDPLKRPMTNARRITMQNSQAKCTYTDPKTGRICGSTYQVQIDHIIPKALGGSDDPENLRTLCRQHNILMGEKILGKECMNKWRNPPKIVDKKTK